ncbi:MAG: hypothetical protein ACI85O_003105, partial [Saprospiraceae bacterium]
NSSVVQTMQRFLKENYRKNLALKFIRINNVTYLAFSKKTKNGNQTQKNRRKLPHGGN